jgi:hypothetical protein
MCAVPGDHRPPGGPARRRRLRAAGDLTLTRAAVEHHGREALSDAQRSEDCALPGGYTADAYNQGWETILHHFTNALEHTDWSTP